MRTVLAILVLAPALGFAQDFKYERAYPDSALAIVSLLPGDAKAAAKEEGAGKGFAAKVTYTGGVRPLTARNAAALKAWAVASALPEQRLQRYVREFEFQEAGVRYWLPLAEGGDFAKHMKAGEKMQVFVRVPGNFEGTKLVIVRGINRGWDRSLWISPSDEASEEVRRTRQETQDAMQKVVDCLAKFAASNPAVGVPDSLAALGPGGTRCLEANVAAGSLGHHTVQFWPAVRDAKGHTPAYFACARPTRPMLDGVDVFGADERGPAKNDSPDYDDGTRTCGQAAHWDYDDARHVKACLVLHADPGTGYAANLLAFGPRGNRCLSFSGEGLYDTMVAVRSGVHVHYEADNAVPRTRYILRMNERTGRGHRVEAITLENGARLASLRTATRQSEPYDAFLAKLLAKDEADRRRDKTLEPTCEAGNARDCYELAHLRMDVADSLGAQRLWVRACDGGVRESCIFDRQRLAKYFQAGPWQEGCRQGKLVDCRQRSALEPGRLFSDALIAKRDCDAGDKAACALLQRYVEKLATGEPMVEVEKTGGLLLAVPPAPR